MCQQSRQNICPLCSAVVGKRPTLQEEAPISSPSTHITQTRPVWDCHICRPIDLPKPKPPQCRSPMECLAYICHLNDAPVSVGSVHEPPRIPPALSVFRSHHPSHHRRLTLQSACGSAAPGPPAAAADGSPCPPRRGLGFPARTGPTSSRPTRTEPSCRAAEVQRGEVSKVEGMFTIV